MRTSPAKATDPDKRGSAMERVGDAYDRALNQFTEVLRNQNDRFEAWNYVGYIHLRLGAYREAIDDYNHTARHQAGSRGGHRTSRRSVPGAGPAG